MRNANLRSVLIGFFVVLESAAASGQVFNVKVVTDANPDYTDLPSLVRSATSRWETPVEQCRAMFYWNHIARRQTNPIVLHGMALTDPIRQFNDYGYTMCSTISGINQSIWEEMGLRHRYWDISNHTVSEVFYDGRWHVYDNSLSALYTLCDGKTLAGVEDVGKEGACAASGGKVEPGHIAKYHCLTATSPRGFLSGADTMRSLDEEYRCFNPNGLKLRTYYYDWDRGHRYILNVRPGESYTRTYHSLGNTPRFFVPNENGKDPELVNPRYHLRGNGEWRFEPNLTDTRELARAVHSMQNVTVRNGGLTTAGDANGWAVFTISSANVMTGLEVSFGGDGSGRLHCSVSRDNGLHWAMVDVDPAKKMAVADARVNGAYEALVRLELDPGVVVRGLQFLTTTALNTKTQPRLNVGRNTVYVGAGDQTESTVLWPELQGDKYKEMIVEEKGIKSAKKHPGYMGVIYPAAARQDGYLVYRIDTPGAMTKLTYGGRFYNRVPGSHADLLHSFDGGKSWTKSWSLTETAQPWDVIHYETVAAPDGCRSALVKYVLNSPDASTAGCSIYALRMEADSKPTVEPARFPLMVTFTWNEVRKDHTLVKRSHTQLVDRPPTKYTIDVGGEDHPVMESLTIGAPPAFGDVAVGYSDGVDVGGERFVGRWETVGRNLAVRRPYTVSVPSETTWGAGDPDGTKLTDGVAGPAEAGGASYQSGAIWSPRKNPVITLDLGASQACAAFGMNFHGYPWRDALRGEVTDRVEVQVSDDGKDFRSVGFLGTELRWKDLPVNHVWPDDERITGHTFRLVPEEPVPARFVRYRVTSDRSFCCTELEVLDAIASKPFDMKIALPE